MIQVCLQQVREYISCECWTAGGAALLRVTEQNGFDCAGHDRGGVSGAVGGQPAGEQDAQWQDL